MAEITDEDLMLFADRRLSDQDTARVADAVARDPSLQVRLDVFTASGHDLREAFSAIAKAPVPARLIEAIMTAHVPLAARVEPQPKVNGALFDGVKGMLDGLFGFGRPRYAPVFATVLLAVGAIGGWQLHNAAQGPSDAAPMGTETARFSAQGLLGRALETARAGEITKANVGTASVNVRLSFKSRANGYCRQYDFDAGAGSTFAGIACRTPDGQWQIEYHAPAVLAASSTERSVPVADAKRRIADMVGAMSEGDALDLEEEDKVRARQWR